MTDEPTTRSGDVREPDPDEARLRKALAMTDDLQPPRDDLFAQRALQRGRARTARRRNGVLGAAAAAVVVAAVGGSWALSGGRVDGTTTAGSASSAESAPQTPAQERAVGTDAGTAGAGLGALAPTTARAPGVSAPQVPPARDGSEFFGALSTPATRGFDALAGTVTTRWPDVFSGAYADDPGGAKVVVALTRPDDALTSYVTASMPAGSVTFVDATYTWADKVRVAAQVREDASALRGLGVDVQSVGVDARADRVVVAADEGASPGLLVQRYGPVVSVVPVTATAPPKLPNGSVLPTLQR